MTDTDTLMAYLIPRLTNQVENAATDALAYILNRSTLSLQALNNLLQEGDYDIEPIARVETQVTYEDGSRPDLTGYDKRGVKRLLVEAKFWAALLDDQASGYARQFDQTGSAVLLFVSPEIRIPTLWAEITRQLEKQSPLEVIDSPSGVRRAKVIGADRHVVLVSWTRLLDSMAALAGDASVQADIQQLRGLAQRQDAESFSPIHSEDLSPNFGRRVIGYNQLVDDVVDSRGVQEQWMDIDALRATPQRYGYGRYFRFSGVSGSCWFGINHERWARSGDTPLWLLLSIGSSIPISIDEIGRQLKDDKSRTIGFRSIPNWVWSTVRF